MKASVILILLFGFLLAPAARAQTNVLQHVDNKVTFSKTIEIPGLSKAKIYPRVKQWMLKNLEYSDTWFEADDAGMGSITTMAYVMLENSAGMANQIISYRLNVAFTDGQISLSGKDFVYDGMGPRAVSLPLDILEAKMPVQAPGVLSALEVALNTMFTDIAKAAKRRR